MTANDCPSAHEKVLLIGRAGEIRGVDLEAPLVHMIPTLSGPHVTSPASLAFVAAERSIYWADSETGELKRAALTGGDVRVLGDAGPDAPRGFAVDWAAGVLYYAAGGALHVARTAGTHARALRPARNVSALCVDPRRGRLYWAAREPDAERVFSATGAASDVRALLDSRTEPRLSGVTSLCADVAAGRVYWVNAGSDSVMFVGAGGGRATLLALAGARPLALEVYGGELLWADAGGHVRACHKDSCAPQSARVLRNDTGHSYFIIFSQIWPPTVRVVPSCFYFFFSI